MRAWAERHLGPDAPTVGVRGTPEEVNEPAGARTQDLRIKSPLLYQLSYRLADKLTPAPDERDGPSDLRPTAFSHLERDLLRLAAAMVQPPSHPKKPHTPF